MKTILPFLVTAILSQSIFAEAVAVNRKSAFACEVRLYDKNEVSLNEVYASYFERSERVERALKARHPVCLDNVFVYQSLRGAFLLQESDRIQVRMDLKIDFDKLKFESEIFYRGDSIFFKSQITNPVEIYASHEEPFPLANLSESDKYIIDQRCSRPLVCPKR
jgi:hypothetical protein